MWVKSENPNLEQIFYKGFMDEPLEFNDSGKAQTTKDVGEKLVEKVGNIKPVEDDDDEKSKPKTKDRSKTKDKPKKEANTKSTNYKSKGDQ